MDYILSITQLNEYVGSLLSNDALLRGVSIRGEVSGLKRHSSGHIYFSMKDESSLIRCVMFKPNAFHAPRNLRDGLSVVANGRVSLYTRDGQYQFYVDTLEEEGEGELYRRFMLLKTRLEAKGLFDAGHKRSLPLLPRAIGVVTSQTGAVIQDIISVAQRRFINMPIVLYPAAVQGDGAAEEIAAGIRALNVRNDVDVIIIGRGGGSMEDLWAFNEETLAYAIYESAIPIISAVGHETDYSISDFVADLRAPTPSAAAELCVPELDALLEGLHATQEALKHYMKVFKDEHRAALLQMGLQLERHSPRNNALDLRRDLVALHSEFSAAMQNALVLEQGRLQRGKTALDALAPKRVLERGFAMVIKEQDASYIQNADEMLKESRATVMFYDGSVKVEIAGGKDGKNN